MARLGRSPAPGDNPLVTEQLDINVIVWNHDFTRRITLSKGNVLTPLRIDRMVGERGGAAELEHSGYSFGPYGTDDEKILIGAWVLIQIEGTVEFVGRIMSVSRNMGGEGEDDYGGSDRTVYIARDIWAVLADKTLDATFEDGISPGGVFGVLRGEPYTSVRRIGNDYVVSRTQYDNLLPRSKNGTLLIDISDELVSSGFSTIPRRFDAAPVSEVMADMAVEAGIEVLDFEPAPLGSSKLGTIVGRNRGDERRSLVFGAPSRTDWEDLSEIPYAISLSGTVDYQGVITQVTGLGGDITEAMLAKLLPAWDETLTSAVIENPKLARDQEGVYGMVGRVFHIGSKTEFNAIVPFTEVPTQKAMEDAFGTNQNANYQEHVQLFEFIAAKASNGDILTPTAWRENPSPWILVQEGSKMWFKNQINYHGMKDASWDRNNFALVVFAEPQFNKMVIEERIGVGNDPDDFRRYEYFLPKSNMYMECMRKVGRVQYTANHRGNFPFVRERVYVDESFRKHLRSYQNNSPWYNGHLRKTATGLTEKLPDVPGLAQSLGWFDNTPQLANIVERMANEHSVPENSIEIHISGIDKSWKVGQRLESLIDADGSVFMDDLDWDVMQVSYSMEECITRLMFDNRLRIGAM